MRVVFMGTPAFAVPSLELLATRHEVVLALTMPDRASGRGSTPRPSAVKQTAARLGIPLLQPQTLKGDATQQVARLHPDVICVVAFGMLLPAELLEVPRFGCLNVHASLLPKYRGAAPIQRAILAGEPVTGVSIMRLEAGLDTGPYALQRPLPVEQRYAEEVEADLSVAGGEALVEVLDALSGGEAVWIEQDEARATYAPKVTKDDVALSPELTVAEAFARVRAATHRAPARACAGTREITVVRARPADEGAVQGGVCVSSGVPLLGFADGALALEVVRPAGKGDMSAAEWARGARIGTDECWRCTR